MEEDLKRRLTQAQELREMSLRLLDVIDLDPELKQEWRDKTDKQYQADLKTIQEGQESMEKARRHIRNVVREAQNWADLAEEELEELSRATLSSMEVTNAIMERFFRMMEKDPADAVREVRVAMDSLIKMKAADISK